MLRNISSRLFSTSTVIADPNKIAPLSSVIQAQYFIPRTERKSPNEIFDLDSHQRLVRSTRLSPSRDVNFTPSHWEAHKSVWRHWRHMRKLFKSSPFQRLAFPSLFFNGSIGTALVYYNTEIAETVGAQITMDPSAMAGVTTAVGLLAGFRLHSSYGRYDEARKFWGEINNASRDLAGNALMWLHTKDMQDRMLNLIKAFPVATHFHLNHKGGHYKMKRNDEHFKEKLDAEYYSEMLDIFQDESDPDFVRIVTAFRSGASVPLHITSGMRQTIAENKKHTDAIYNQEMDQNVSRLVGCLGMCERVLRTPLPVCFTRHTSRLFFLWSNMLPFAMYSSLGVAMVPASLMVSWAILGIEDVGVQLEEPFNMLPIRQYSEGMYAGVDDIRKSYMLGYPFPETEVNFIDTEAMMETKLNGKVNGVNGSLNGLNGKKKDTSVDDIQESSEEQGTVYEERLMTGS